MDQATISKLIVIGAIAVALAINVIIVGLVLIAIVHDGTTGVQVAQTFQTILINSITAIGTLAGSLITGQIMHRAMVTRDQAVHQAASDARQGNGGGGGGGSP